MQQLSLVISVFLLGACGGAGKGTAASKAESMCPATAAQVKETCGCRPTEEYYVSMADQLGMSEAARAGARQCANGNNPGDKMAACMKQNGASSAMMALAGSPTTNDNAFETCLATLPK